jgi:hypothetical protein
MSAVQQKQKQFVGTGTVFDLLPLPFTDFRNISAKENQTRSMTGPEEFKLFPADCY